ncbi:D-alanine--D-alanine ligase [Lachnospiraceae bacterium TWA4]|nr:D-alanine--D-alanine ligase [Lachnospiraceae bacterium TWA4]
MNKEMVAVLFGGQSSEHEVSCVSVQTVIKNLDMDKYDILMIGITKEGCWLKADSIEDIKSGKWRESKTHAVLSPDASVHGFLLYEGNELKTQPVDIVFPVLHGLYGEDGTIQGILELSRIPYVGCGVLSSAVSMDKFYTKVIVDEIGVLQAAYEPVLAEELVDSESVAARVESRFDYPVFIKPSRSGSSQGVHKAKNHDELITYLKDAARFDRKILVEEMIKGREIECAVLGGYAPKASGVGEIVAAAEFYDYEAKYENAESKTIIDPDLPEEVVEKIRENAVKIFKAVDGFGLSRVDFFVTEDGKAVFNEINTLPGFTSISMYPMLWAARGISTKDLVSQLIDLAKERR